MNRKQLVALWVGITLFVLVGLWPPWIEFRESPKGGILSQGRLGHVSLLLPPASKGYRDLTAIDIPALAIYWILIAALTAGAILTLADRKR